VLDGIKVDGATLGTFPWITELPGRPDPVQAPVPAVQVASQPNQMHPEHFCKPHSVRNGHLDE